MDNLSFYNLTICVFRKIQAINKGLSQLNISAYQSEATINVESDSRKRGKRNIISYCHRYND